MFEAVGTDRIVVIDIHNLAAFQNAFRRGAAPLDAQAIFARYIAAEIGEEPLAVVSPDLGGEKRANCSATEWKSCSNDRSPKASWTSTGAWERSRERFSRATSRAAPPLCSTI